MSGFEGLAHLSDQHHHHRFGSLSGTHRRSDSVESHGSISSLSSNHSSINGGNGGNPAVTPSADVSRFRRVEPPRSLNTGVPAKSSGHAYHLAPREVRVKSSRPNMMLLHSTSVMETPGRQQTLNRSRSGSCPIVWDADSSLRERPLDPMKQRHPQSNFVTSPPSAYGTRNAERSLYGQMTGSVLYAGSQHDDCRALGGAKMSQNPGVSTPEWHAAAPAYDRRRAFERCPTENCLSDFARSPSISVSSLQRSLSTMSMGVVPNSSFTSKLNCSLSQSYTNKLNDFSHRSDEHINKPRSDTRSVRPNFFHTKLPSQSMEMGINYNVPKSGQGNVRRQRDAFEKDVMRKDPDAGKIKSCLSPKIAPFGNRGQYKYRSFENINSASNKCNQMSAVAPNEARSNGQLHCITPVENRFNKRLHIMMPKELKHEGATFGFAPSSNKRGGRLLPPTPVESKCDSSNVQASAHRVRNDHVNSVNSEDGELDETPDTPSPDKIWNWSPLKSLGNSQNHRKVGGSLTSLRSVVAAATSDNEWESKSPDGFSESGSTPKAEERSMYVSEMFVNIAAKPRPASGFTKVLPDGLKPLGKRPLTSSVSSYDLPSNSNPKCKLISRSSLPSAVAVVDRVLGSERKSSAGDAVARNRRHSNPGEKTAEVLPDVRKHVANQKECFTGLLKGINDLYQYRENLRTYVAQLERETQERRRVAATQHLPSMEELEQLCDSNRQLQVKIRQLGYDVRMARSRAGQSGANCDDGGAWSCAACTFMNHPALSICECCELPRLSFVMR